MNVYNAGFPAFRRLDAILTAGLAAARARYGDPADSLRGLYVSAEQAAVALDGSAGSPLLASGGPGPDAPDWNSVCADDAGWAWVRDTYRLSDRELDVVLIALAADTDLRYERCFAYLQDDVNRRRPTVDLILNLLTDTIDTKLAGRGDFRPDRPLVGHRIITLTADPAAIVAPLLAHIVTLDEQIADVLLRQSGLDRRLARYCRLIGPGARPGTGDRAGDGADDWADTPLLADERTALAAATRSAWAVGRPLRLYFQGPIGSGRRTTARALAGELAAPVLVADLGLLTAPGADPEADGTSDIESMYRLFREASLHGAVLYLDGLDALDGDRCGAARRALADGLAGHETLAILAGHRPWTPLPGEPLGVVTVSFTEIQVPARRRIWERRLADHGVSAAPADLDALAGRFRLGPVQISDAVATAVTRAGWRAGGKPATPRRSELFAAARGQSGHGLSRLARRIEPAHGWDDLVLPPDSVAQLRDLCQRVALRERVLTDWGFQQALSRGCGTTALFTGPPGTGKTMAAEVIARDLGLDLFTIDLSTVISKYIGETEKNLEQVFSAAADADAILFFDEADALFGKRSEVRDSHDRYANIEISYLLQRMERYDGLAVLATNLRQHIDDAFTRRLQFVVDFPFPDEVRRARIWERCFPAGAPVDPALDTDRLAYVFRLSGANIRNIALHAAYLAAAEGTAIGRPHVLEAIRREHQKLGKVLTDSELDLDTPAVPAV